ncbi:hypothetical protein O181_063444 [Austropuccinia psidii MF-1]|uniref:Uncharacterized protein n=1 Tax=Austropuccinia psidii MF-1 TaxID=1389203 RepID=A0A9Q3EMG7_9BASI|nr:hypothetical protein [Austropuccinia psidii MF-1]
MDKIGKANLNMPKLELPFSHIRSLVRLKEEIKNPVIADLNHQDNSQVLVKEGPQLKKWPRFIGEGEYYNMSFIKPIDMLQDYEITDELITTRIPSLLEKSSKRWY